MSQGIKAVLIVLAVLVGLAAMIFMWGMGQYNKVIAMDEQVNAQWAQVEN